MMVTIMLKPARIIEMPIRPKAKKKASMPCVACVASGSYPVQPVGNPPNRTPDSRIT